MLVASLLVCGAQNAVGAFRWILGNVGIEAVSKMLRHRTTRTTELFYARIRDEKAFAEAERAWGVGISIPAD